MAAQTSCRTLLNTYMRTGTRQGLQRTITTSSTRLNAQTPSGSASSSTEQVEQGPTTHFKITLRRSAISLGDKKKGTLKALGIHRRHQTVFFPHGPEVAGKILAVKELVEVENVPTEKVMTKQEQRQARKAPRGYKVVGSRRDNFMNA
ncbi:hypothetical protein CVT24_011056 [Panaeolus cyanescens]|uniref:Large ribosomal subunit protein uL30m n=1 Tax=Panaeolus cyanescens TaxID=181874 RepID=A0A409VG12_9AGAR|nr:hypothetical protein CVT24_011056 [Panaeolus cyanescens]